jgi:hypothetical protein
MMIAAMMVAAISANAQNEVGQLTLKPTVGLNIASMTKGEDTKVRPGFVAGVEAEYGVSENFGVQFGLLYSQQGVKGKNIDFGELDFDENDNVVGGWAFSGDATMKLDYINIPILAQYYPVKGLALKAGIQPGFCVSKKYDGEGNMTIAGQTIFSDQEKGKIEDAVNAFQFAIPVGLSYEYKNIVLDARYNIFLSKAFKDNDVNKLVGVADSRHSVFSITLGYKIPLN